MQAYPVERVASIIIKRPVCGIEVWSMRHSDWMANNTIVIFPDGVEQNCSDYPHSGITVCCKWQGHFVFGRGHKECWVLSSTSVSEIKLDVFGPDWQGCNATVVRY